MTVEHILDFTRVNGDSFCRHDVSEESNFLHPKLTLVEFGIGLTISKLIQDQAKVLFMFFPLLEYTRILSINTMTYLSKYSMNTLFIKFIK